MNKVFAAIEAGGTKFVCGVGTGPDDIEEIRFPTTHPAETLAKATDFFSAFKNEISAMGVGSFGPIDREPSSSRFGFITNTPKKLWVNADVIGALKRKFDCPMAFDTDVNAAALGESIWGAGLGLSDLVYITVGTGIGGGILSGGKLVHGLVHPELGHMFVGKHPDDEFKGNCPFHRDRCLEGLCAGPAIEARWSTPGFELAKDHPAWNLQAYYLAQALSSIICILSPQKIILGGGVMDQPSLLSKVRAHTREMLAGYVQHSAILRDMDTYICSPGLGNRAGLLGSLALAKGLIEDAR